MPSQSAWSCLLFGLFCVLFTGASCKAREAGMNSPNLHPSSHAITAFYDGEFVEFFVVRTDPKNSDFMSVQFFESRPDLGEIKRLKQVAWGIPVPKDAALFVATSGRLRDDLGTFWAGWRTEEGRRRLPTCASRTTTRRANRWGPRRGAPRPPC